MEEVDSEVVLDWVARNARQVCLERSGAGVDARVVEDLPDCRRRDLVPEAGQLAMDAPVPPAREMLSSTFPGLCEARGYVELVDGWSVAAGARPSGLYITSG